MKNTNFWTDAARYGAFLGVAEIVFAFAGMYTTSWAVSLLHLVATVGLLTLFTRRRVALYGTGDEGYGYGACLKYIFFVSLFAGILLGAYSIVAANFLFPERYHELVDKTVSALAQTGLYGDTMLAQMKGMYDKMFFSPIYVVLTNAFAMAIRGGFFGLFIAAFTRREARMFGNDEIE